MPLDGGVPALSPPLFSYCPLHSSSEAKPICFSKSKPHSSPPPPQSTKHDYGLQGEGMQCWSPFTCLPQRGSHLASLYLHCPNPFISPSHVLFRGATADCNGHLRVLGERHRESSYLICKVISLAQSACPHSYRRTLEQYYAHHLGSPDGTQVPSAKQEASFHG